MYVIFMSSFALLTCIYHLLDLGRTLITLNRYKYENNRVMEASSPDMSSPLQYQLYNNGKIGIDASSRGTQNQLLERQVFFLFLLLFLLDNYG